MKLSSTLVLLLLAVAAWLVVRYVVLETPGTRERIERGQYVTMFNGDQIDSITIHRRDAKIILQRDETGWQMLEPVQDIGDRVAISQLIGELEMIPRADTIEAENDQEKVKKMHRDFGLVEPKILVELSGGDVPAGIFIGDETAIQALNYLRLDHEDAVHVVPGNVREMLSRPVDDFRDPRVTSIPWDTVHSIEIQRPDGQIKLELVRGEWVITRPLSARADGATADEILRAVVDAPILKFAPAAATSASYDLGGTPPSITLVHGDDERLVVELGRLATEEELGNIETSATYVHLPHRSTICLIPAELSNLFSLSPNDLRDRKLVRLDLDTVDRFTLTPSGSPEFSFARQGEEWFIRWEETTYPANAAMAMAFLDVLRSTQVADFVADTPGDLKQYAFDAPQLRVRISSFTSENVPGAGLGEHPLATISFGRSEGEIVFARLDQEPFIVAVDRELFSDIPIDPVLWRSLDIFAYDAKELTSLTLQRGDRSTRYTRAEDSQWHAGDGQTFDPEAVESAIGTLASMHAVRWIGPRTHGHGFASPISTIIIELTDGTTHTLHIGAAEDDGRHFASLGEEDATFLISPSAITLLLSPDF